LLLHIQQEDWFDDATLLESLEPLLMSLCAWYLTRARKRDEPLDSVARFHLRNGASLQRINWLADTSPNGFKQSAGMLVNYVYNPDKIVRNHERYVKDGNFAFSKDIVDLAPLELHKEKRSKSSNQS